MVLGPPGTTRGRPRCLGEGLFFPGHRVTGGFSRHLPLVVLF